VFKRTPRSLLSDMNSSLQGRRRLHV